MSESKHFSKIDMRGVKGCPFLNDKSVTCAEDEQYYPDGYTQYTQYICECGILVCTTVKGD